MVCEVGDCVPHNFRDALPVDHDKNMCSGIVQCGSAAFDSEFQEFFLKKKSATEQEYGENFVPQYHLNK